MKRSARFTTCCVLAGCLAIAQSNPDFTEADAAAELEKLMSVRVQTVTLRKQKLQDAPANVTVVSAEDIRRYGYRTLAEVLANVRSFYTTSDGAFTFAGVRGFGLLGDYNMRFLVMINGHRLTDIVYGAMYYFGQDFPLDMNLVEQIEVVRGPSSALYGSNGVFATINIITGTPQASAPASTAMEMGSFGEQKATLATAFAVGKHGSAILSGSAFRTHGRDVHLSSPHEELPPARNLGNERGFHTFANLVWKDWRLTAVLGTRRVAASHGWYGATVGDTGTMDLESRNYLEAAWSRRVGERGEWNWKTYYDQFRYDGKYRYDGDDPYTNFDGAFGDWVGSDLTYRYEWNRLGALTVGAELKHEIRNTQYSYDVGDGSNASSAIRNLREHPDSAHAFLVQHELALSPTWTLYAGGRLDDSRRNSAYFSPRIALVTDRGHSTYKFMYGRAFRNPSTFERYWEPNPDLIAEAMNTLEFVAEHRMGKRTSLTGSVYHYRLASLIEGVPVSDTTLQYRNTAGAAATGAEVEVSTSVADWLQTTSAFTIQRIRRTGSHALFPNSPVPLALLRGAVPLRKVRLTMTAAVRYVGSRTDAYGGQVPSTLFADGTFTTNRSRGGVEMQFGVRNMLNRRYSDPLSPEHTPHMLPGTGRTWFVRLCWARE